MAALFAIALPASLAIFLVGLGWRLLGWLRRPVPPGAALTPAPRTRAGVAKRLALETFTFRSLWRASRWTWFLGMALHGALLLTFAGHLRLLTWPVWASAPSTHWLAMPVGLLFVAALLGLALRRVVVDRVRYISTPADFLWLALLGGIALSGLGIGAEPAGTGLALREYIVGLAALEVRALPASFAVTTHLSLVCVLLALFPFGKLLHGPGVLMSPARATRARYA